MEQNFQLHAQLRKDQGLQLSPSPGHPGFPRSVQGAITQDVDALRAEVQQLRGELRQVTLKKRSGSKENGCWMPLAAKDGFSLSNTWVTWNDRLKSNFGTFMNFHEVFRQNMAK